MKIDPNRIPAIWRAAADGMPLADIGARVKPPAKHLEPGDIPLLWELTADMPDSALSKKFEVSKGVLQQVFQFNNYREESMRVPAAVRVKALKARASRQNGSGVQRKPRRQKVLESLIMGKSNREISTALSIPISTVKNDVAHLAKQYECADRLELVVRIYRATCADSPDALIRRFSEQCALA